MKLRLVFNGLESVQDQNQKHQLQQMGLRVTRLVHSHSENLQLQQTILGKSPL